MCVASLAAALFGGKPLVSLLGDGQTDSLSSGQGHPRLVALETERMEEKQEFVNVDQRERRTQVANRWTLGHGVLFCSLLLDIVRNLVLGLS